jgi:hypothetical protein
MSLGPRRFKDSEKAFTLVVPKSPLGSRECLPDLKRVMEVPVHVLRGGL